MESTLDRIRQRREAAAVAAAEGYRRLVHTLADGGDPGEIADAVLTAAGRDLEQLAADVESLRQHRLDLATLETGDDVRAALKAASVALGEHERQTQEIVKLRAADAEILLRKKGAAGAALQELVRAEQRVADFRRERAHLADSSAAKGGGR